MRRIDSGTEAYRAPIGGVGGWGGGAYKPDSMFNIMIVMTSGLQDQMGSQPCQIPCPPSGTTLAAAELVQCTWTAGVVAAVVQRASLD